MTAIASSALLACGWALALAAATAALLLRARLARAHAGAARAAHEIRGPLCAARLVLATPPDARGVAALDLELRRAALAVEDLEAAWPRRGIRAAFRPAGGLAAASRAMRAAGPAEDVAVALGGERPGPVDLAALVRVAAPGWSALCARHGASLEVVAREPARVDAHPLRLAQALGNLVANAAEHGGGTVRVEVRSVGRRRLVTVSDGGAGLPAPVAARLAAPVRASSDRRGHGLAVARAVAEAYGGRLRPQPGGQVVLELPATTRTPAEPPREPRGAASGEPQPTGMPLPIAGAPWRRVAAAPDAAGRRDRAAMRRAA